MAVKELDYFEYASDAEARAAYVPSKASVNNPIRHWKMNDNEADTVVVDSMGVANGTASANTNTLTVAGKINAALNLNGGQKITLTYANIGKTVSYSIWFNGANGNENNLLSFMRTLIRVSTTKVKWWPDVYGEFVSADISIDDGFHHLVITQTGTTYVIYLDGSVVGSGSTTGEIDITNLSNFIGCYIDTANWPGAVDDARFYNLVLSQDDVTVIYNGGNGTEDQNPIVFQCYSEAAIKEQGDYSLKGIAKQTASLNKYLERTIGSPIDLSNKNIIKFSIRASRIGSNIKVGIRDSGGVYTEVTPNIINADAFQTVEWDISGVTNANKDAIDRIRITIVEAGNDNIFYIDNMYAKEVIIIAAALFGVDF